MTTTEKIALGVAATAVAGMLYVGVCLYCVVSSIPENKKSDDSDKPNKPE
jgi:hypothetical protein